jgi:nucleoside-diphosphate-sugar epimerase
MRILVTGAGGSLGTAVLPILRDAGHVPVGLDVRAGPPGAAWVEADLRDASLVRDAMRGIELVVHAAALHGIHLGNHSPHDFLDLNVVGTFNVWQAAVEEGVRGVVFSSTMGVYGESRVPAGDDRVSILDEAVPLRPGDIYGWTKVAGEELCRYHLRAHGIPSVALRYGMFVPEPFFRYGIRLLYGGVHEQDVARAVLAAVEALAAGDIAHAAFNVESPLPFAAADAADLRRDPLVAIDRHWPGSADLLRERGVRSLNPVTEIFPVARLEQRLGTRPRHDFGAWLAELRARPEVRTDADPPWP